MLYWGISQTWNNFRWSKILNLPHLLEDYRIILMTHTVGSNMMDNFTKMTFVAPVPLFPLDHKICPPNFNC